MKKKKMSRQERLRYDAFLCQLRQYEDRGILMTLSGEDASASQIAKACIVREHGCYMGDYILDEEGSLSEIQFDKIGEEPEQ